MDSFLKMDIFFMVTTASVVVVMFLTAMILYRIYKILGHVEHVSGQVAEEGDLIREDISQMRNDVKAGANKFFASLNFVQRMTNHGARRKKKSAPITKEGDNDTQTV